MKVRIKAEVEVLVSSLAEGADAAAKIKAELKAHGEVTGWSARMVNK